MDIIETIASHTAALRMPLYAVTASAIRKADTPLILTLHWHGFLRDGMAEGGLRAVAGSAVQLNVVHGTSTAHTELPQDLTVTNAADTTCE